jgi:Zn-dependent protease with chaperone function
MKPALAEFGFAAAAAWCAPWLLRRLTARGTSARLGLAAWLTAMVSVLASGLLALQFLAQAAVQGWPSLSEALCRSVTGGTCTPAVYQSAIFELGSGLAAVGALLAVAVLGCRYGLSIQQGRRRTRAHAEAARLTGRRLPGAGAVVLDARQPAAYCVPGRPATVVLTSAALAVLDPPQLSAVLAHERAHLAGRHHLLIALTRGLAVSLPGVPVFGQGRAEVARLAEMCADDVAARRAGRPALITALLAMGTATVVPAAGLAATACAVTARVQRLLEPARPGRRAVCRLALTAGIAALAVAPAFAATLTWHAF